MSLPFLVTFFRGAGASTLDARQHTPETLAALIATTTASAKADLPWLKLARFGSLRTEKGSLRHDANVQAVSGLEADYDGEAMPFADAVEIATKAGLQAILYTSPSNTPGKSRWRVLCPFSEALPAERRAPMMGRLNGLFRGVFAVESWTLSQAFYFGSINSNPAHRVDVIEGNSIDTLDELDETWTGRPNTVPVTATGPVARGGRLDEAEMLEAIVTGAGYHEATTRLLGAWARRGVSMVDAEARLAGAFDGVFPLDRDGRWQQRRDDISRCVDGIYGKSARNRDAGTEPVPKREGKSASRPAAYTPLAVVDPCTLAGQPIPERQWIVKDWLPSGHVTLSYGDGGVGKTLLAQQLMSCCATGALWLGLPVSRCRVFGIFCEDDEAELHRRQDKINAALGLDFGALQDMRWASAVGADNVLVRFERDGAWELTPRFNELTQQAQEFGAKLLVIDTAADTFGGNENDRQQVRAYLGPVLTKLARDTGSAVLLNAHPSRSGMSASGDMDGGSTAWSNTARSRWALTRPDAEDGAAPDENLRVLSRRKSNYAVRGDWIELRWEDGVLASARQARPSGFAAVNRSLGAETTFLQLLDRCTGQNIFVSNSKHAGNFAPKVFAKRPERDGYSRHDFEGAMNSLYAADRITNVRYGRQADERFRIGRPDETASGSGDSEAPDPDAADPIIAEWRQACGEEAVDHARPAPDEVSRAAD